MRLFIFGICIVALFFIIAASTASTASIRATVEETQAGLGYMYIVGTTDLAEVKIHLSDQVQAQSWEADNGSCSLDKLVLHCTNLKIAATTIRIIVLTIAKPCEVALIGASIEGFPNSFSQVRNEPTEDCLDNNYYLPYVRENG